MIVFTGHGKIAEEFCKKFDACVFSFRVLSDVEILQVLERTTVLVHNAANLSPESLEESIDDNFLLTKRIVSLVLKSNRKIRFVLLSSMSILESETSYKVASKMSDYSFGKYLSELYILSSKLSDRVVVRFSTIFHEEASRDGLSAMISSAVRENKIYLLNGGVSKRDFIPISIAVAYLNRIALINLQGAVNVASGVAYSFKEMAAIVAAILKDVKIIDQKKDGLIDPLYSYALDDLRKVGVLNFDIKDYISSCIRKFDEQNTHI